MVSNSRPTTASVVNGARKRVVTIRDVALDAGVAVVTVSRVLNNNGYASAEVRQLVEDAAARLNYRPSRRARSLRRAKSMTIATIVPELVNPVYLDFLRGVQRTAEEREYVVLIGETQRSADRESQLIKRLVDEGIDGVVLGGPLALQNIEILRDSGIPTFPGDGPESRAYTAAWEAAEAEATRQMTSRLIELGHRRVALVVANSPAWPGRLGYRRARTDVIRRELRRCNAELLTIPVGITDLLDAPCQKVFKLKKTSRPTAFIAFSHPLAPRLLLALKHAGINVPDDASFVSYGDSEWAAAHQPALTVVRHDTFAEAAWFTERLLDGIDGINREAASPYVEAKFVERESCAPPPTRRRTVQRADR